MFRTSFLFALATLIALPALAAPTKLVQQGRFLDDAGTPLEGSFSLSFALFDDPSTGAALWSEVQDSVFESGYYAVTLGEQVPLDDLLFATEPVWLEVAIDGQALSPRQEIVSVPYALRATAAEHLEGGMVDAQEISIDGTVVIDASGSWVGPTPDLDWSDLTGIPADLADGDQDTLGGLPCADAAVAKFDGNSGLWSCGTDTDTQLSETQVDAFVANNGYSMGAHTTGLDWSTISNIPSEIADGDQDTQLTETEVDGFVANNGYSMGAHTTDTDTQLTETEVDAFVANNGYSMGAHTTDTNTQLTEGQVDAFVANNNYSTGAHTIDTDTQLSEAQVDTYVANNNYSTGAHTADTNTQLTEGQVDGFVANNGYSMGAHTTDTDTQLTETQVDGFVANNGYSVGAHTTGLDWSAISNIPSDIADGDQDTQLTTVPWNMVTGAPDHVDLAGDTMTGALNLPADGLSVGSSQLRLSGGNVGVGIASPQAPLHVAGMMVQGTSRGTLSSQVASYFTNQATSDYIHIRLPFDPTQAANMFHIKVTGYAYGGSTKVIDITYVGYAYTGTGTIINTEILNPNGGHAPAIYQGSDNNVYLRFRPSTTYYLSFRADSMYVGNGRIIEPGEVTVIRSSASNL